MKRYIQSVNSLFTIVHFPNQSSGLTRAWQCIPLSTTKIEYSCHCPFRSIIKHNNVTCYVMMHHYRSGSSENFLRFSLNPRPIGSQRKFQTTTTVVQYDQYNSGQLGEFHSAQNKFENQHIGAHLDFLQNLCKFWWEGGWFCHK